ncbi:MAG: hypothetical protein ACR2NO_12660 [Chloroflexota bacterium]
MSNTAPATAAITIRQTAANSKWLDATSLGSGKRIAAGDQVVMCPKCFKPVLLDDWKGNGDKCPDDGTPGRVIDRATRGADDGAAAPAATPAASTPVPSAAAGTLARAASSAAPVAAAAVGPAPANVVVDPYRYARSVEAPPVSDVWRRNIMTIFWLVFLWGVFVGLIWLVQLIFGVDLAPRAA